MRPDGRRSSPAGGERRLIVGADRFLEIKGELDVEGIEMEILPGGDSPLSKRLEMVRRAHENLVHIDKRNEGRFSAFLRALSSELSS